MASSPSSPPASDVWTSKDTTVLRIGENVYNISDFQKRHPGGTIIKAFANQDATEAYQAFHLRSKRADRLLQSLPSITIEEYKALRAAASAADSTEADGEGLGAPSKPTSTTYGVEPPALSTTSATLPPTEGDLDSPPDLLAASTSERTQKLLRDFRVLKAELEAEGYFKPDLLHVTFRVVEVILFFVVHFFLLYYSFRNDEAGSKRGYKDLLSPTAPLVFGFPLTLPFTFIRLWSGVLVNPALVLTAFVVGGLAGGRAGWLQHEGGHGSLTGNLKIDKLIQKAGISFGLVCHNGKWNSMHNKHHANPQKADHDPDIDTMPLLATYEEIFVSGRRREMLKSVSWWLKYQHISFLILTAVFNQFFWHFYLHPREYILRRLDLTTLFLVASRYAIHLAIVVPFTGWVFGIFTLHATLFFSGVYLFGNFSLSHTFLPVLAKHSQKNWIDGQFDHTLNIRPSPLVNWWMGYLNCQIEHHLFPQMPQFRQPSILPRVKAFSESHGIKYHFVGYFQALGLMLGNLKEVASVVDAYKEFHEKEEAARKQNTLKNDTSESLLPESTPPPSSSSARPRAVDCSPERATADKIQEEGPSQSLGALRAGRAG